MTAAAIASVAWTISAGTTFGSTWRERDAPRRIADRARGEDEILGLDRHRLPARQADEHRRGRDADRDHRVGEARAEERRQRDREDQERAREHGVGQPRDQHVDPAAGVAREQADGHADRQRDQHRDHAREQRRARAPDDARRARRGRSRRCRTSARRTAPCGSPSSSWRADRRARRAAPAARAPRRTRSTASPTAAPRRRSSRRNGCGARRHADRRRPARAGRPRAAPSLRPDLRVDDDVRDVGQRGSAGCTPSP